MNDDENYYIKPAMIHAHNDGDVDYFEVNTKHSNEGTFATHKEALNYINHERSDLEYLGTYDNREG
jgi:hypothetical protein